MAQGDARAERLAALSKEQSDAMNDYYKALQEAMGDNKNPSAEDWKKIEEKVKEPDTKGYQERAQTLLDENPSDLTGFKTIQWMMNNARDPESSKTAIGLLEKYHMDRPEMADVCDRLTRGPGSALLPRLLVNSPHADVRGRACFAMAEGLKDDIQESEYIKGKDEKELEGMAGYLGAEKLDALKKLDVEKTQQEVEQTYERVVKEFSDVKLYAGTKHETTLGKRAGAALYEIRNLAVGKPTPEIEGVDLDSVAFKLSEYRGKVVLLDFWGNW